MSTYKPFGWESIDRLYGEILARLGTVSGRLQDYLAKRTDAIPELDAELKPVFGLPDGGFPVVHASRVATPSFLKY